MTRHLDAELVDGVGAVLGEGPSWDGRTGELVWVDLLGGVVHIHDGDGQRVTDYEVGGHVGAVLPAEDGGWLLAMADGFAHLDRTGMVEPLLAVEADRPENRFNDAKCDQWGQAVAGTMRYDERAGSAALYRLEAADPDGRNSTPIARVLLDHLGLSNGLGWSADGGTLYFIDTLSRAVASYAYSPVEAELGPRQVVAAIAPADGMPDGMCVDRAGNLWVALYNGGAVHCFTPDGQLDTVVSVPVPRTTSVAFGGPRGDRLFITTGGGTGAHDDNGIGGLWAVDPGVDAPPATPWRSVNS